MESPCSDQHQNQNNVYCLADFWGKQPKFPMGEIPMGKYSLVTQGSAVEETLSRWTSTGILNLSCNLDLDHNRAIQSFHKTIQLMVMCHPTKFTCKRINSSEDTLESHILIIWSITVALTLKTTNQSFLKTALTLKTAKQSEDSLDLEDSKLKQSGSLWCVPYQTTGSAIQKISYGQTFIGILKFCCDLDLEHNNPISQ